MIDGCDIWSETAVRLTSRDLNDDNSTLIQVIAWWRQATNHYLNQCWPRSRPPNGGTRPQWVKYWILSSFYPCFYYPVRCCCQGLLSQFHAFVGPSVRPSLCLERLYHSTSLRISTIALTFGEMIHSTVKQIGAKNGHARPIMRVSRNFAKLIDNFVPHHVVHVIDYPCQD